jgi:hypothetical protein
MNVSPLPSALQSLLAAREQPQLQRPDATGTTATPAQRAATTAASTTAATTARPASAQLTAQAPEGTDPALWSVLTSQERAFFSRVVTSGPLTYSKMAAATSNTAAMPSIRGGRIDLRA